MGPDSTAAANGQSDVMLQWSARKVPPIVLLYVAIVFLVMMALAFFVVHSEALGSGVNPRRIVIDGGESTGDLRNE